MTTTPAITGTISHGTLRPQDLGPAFLTALQILDPEAQEVLTLAAHDIDWDSDEGADLLDEIMSAINEALPEEWYFSAHEGDGSDFGIFRDERPPYEEEPGDAPWLADGSTLPLPY